MKMRYCECAVKSQMIAIKRRELDRFQNATPHAKEFRILANEYTFFFTFMSNGQENTSHELSLIMQFDIWLFFKI